MRRLVAVLMWLILPGYLSPAQEVVVALRHPTGFPPLALGVNASTDNGATSSATVAVTLGTPTAGSTISCAVHYSNSATFTSVTDNVNTGSYFPRLSLAREPNHNYIEGIYYHENAGASATTVTLTYSPAEAQGKMACKEIKNTPTSYAADSNFVAYVTATGANPTTGSTLTPTQAGEFIEAALSSDGVTNTAGTSYTLLGSMTGTAAAQLVPEYWIQTTATSTNGPYTNATSRDYGDGMAAWAPKQTGTCGLSAVIDWSGGTAGNVPAIADLESSTHGNAPQPNADRSAQLAYGSTEPGVWVANGASIHYSSAAYVPLQTTRNCPFYNGSGAPASAIGLDWPTSDTTHGPEQETFDTVSNTVSAWTCMSTTINPGAVASKTTDVLTLARADNSDYVNLQWNVSGGGVGFWELEAKAATCQSNVSNACNSSTTWSWAQNTWYGIRMIYSSGASHSIAFYSYSGSKCTGTPTLMGTMTATTESAGPPNTLNLLTSTANTYASGSDIYMGAVELDILYGSALTP